MSGSGKRRLFLAVDVTDEMRHALAACLDGHLALDPGWRIVPPANWHITLRFLGWATDVQRDVVTMQIAERELPASFSVRVGGLGAFPRPTKATVLWLGVVDNSEGLSQLAAAAEDAAVAAGFAAEERPYHAHLTLARMRPQVDVRELLAGFGECGFELEVDAITLFESHIDRGGARYEALDRIPLS